MSTGKKISRRTWLQVMAMVFAAFFSLMLTSTNAQAEASKVLGTA
jgi:hypothetical protein